MSTTQPESIVKANSVIGVKVKSQKNENLGDIQEIMIDKLSGDVRYVVLAFGGILGLGEKLFALPWRSLSYDEKDSCFIINLDKETLKDAPGFDKSNWPNMADPLWLQSMKAYYGDYEAVKEKLSHFKDKAKSTYETVADKTQYAVAKGACEAKKCGQDWINYIQEHPVQSFALGAAALLALKSLVKED